ncbi:substrate-binding domain-containing protein [Streptacidiphilus sp. N1-3]|uniref:Substrate-binding domain-containing protein n=1 Tax=Streptacidiphilus alkalitolerans TaxID=3342712 RepID=A0ABV6WZY3_9ACTN
MNPSGENAGTAARGHKTRRLADELRRGIAELRWPGGRLPTEQDLAQDQQVSVNTVRRAVDLLVQEGLVYRRQGSGTYVADRPTGLAAGYAVGVVVPSLTYYYPRVIAGVERQLNAHGARMLLRCTDWDPAVERGAAEDLVQAGVRGLILVPTLDRGALPSWLGELDRGGVPLVLAERGIDEPATPREFVCSHHAAGAREAVEHLVGLGHRRIAYLERTSPHTAPQVRAGLALALGQMVPGTEPALTRSLPRWTAEDAEEFVRDAVARGVTAVLCFADREAALLVGAARRRGLEVPGDLSVIGYDDEVADLCEVPLTAVSPAKTEVGLRAVDILTGRIADPSSPRRQEILLPRLVLRDSTGQRAGEGLRCGGEPALPHRTGGLPPAHDA